VTSKTEQDLVALNQALRLQATRDDCDDLHRAVVSLRMVLRFLGDHVSGDALPPLRRLHAAVTDVEAGGKPRLFVREKKAGRPSGFIEHDLRGMLAGALDLLVRVGMTPRNAAAWLSKVLHQAGLSRGEIRPAQIVSWRTKASALEGPQLVIDMLQQLRLRHEHVASLPEAQRIAARLVDVVVQNWTTSETPIFGES
jgi:hypothetical protein